MSSNGLMVALAMVLVVVSVVGMGFSYVSLIELKQTLSGFATDTATTNLSVNTNAAISFGSNDYINFGSGSVVNGSVGGVLSSNGLTTNTTGFTQVTNGFVLENIGNTNVTLDIMTQKTAAQFIGGTSPTYQYNITDKDAGSCTAAAGFSLGTFYEVNTTSPGTRVCDIFQFLTPKDEIRIDIKLFIPSDSYTGALGDILTATATATS